MSTHDRKGFMVDTKALRSFSYGLYLVTTVDAQGKRAGCVVNTAAQVSSKPYRVLVTVNKENATCGAIQETGKFALTVLSQETTMDLIATFGFKSSADFDKFADLGDVRELLEGVPCVADSAVAVLGCSVHSETDAGTHVVFIADVVEAEVIDGGAALLEGVPCVADSAVAVLGCSVHSETDAGTHVVFIADVVEAEVIDGGAAPLTYEYYHRVLKGTTPPKASAFVAEEVVPAGTADEMPMPQLHHFRCNLCGYVYETEESELPADFKCPLCGAGASMFKKVD